MKNIYLKKSTLIFAVLSYLFLFFTTAISAATPYGTNIVINGNAETGNLTGWTAMGTHAAYFVNSVTTPEEDAAEAGHNYVFDLYMGGAGSDNLDATLYQTIDISDIQTQIAAGLVSATFSGQVWSWETDGYASFTIEQISATNSVLATHTSGTLYPGQNGKSPYKWTTQTLSLGTLNANTTSLKIYLHGHTSTIINDYIDFDNIQLILSTVPTVTTTAISTYDVTSATMGGNVTADGGATVSERGVVYSSSDAIPTIGESGVTTDTNGTSAGSFSESISGLSGNTTYYVRAYATNTAGTSYGAVESFTTLTTGTFTGASGTDWNTAGNWAGGSVPTSATDVSIPTGKTVVIGPTVTASCKNLTVTGSLTIQSSGSGTGSLIFSGTATGSVNCQRYMTNGKWHLISPTASGQTVADFLTANTNIPTSSTTRGMMDYNTLGNSWNSYYPTTSASGSIDAGKGYAARIATADGTITFTGTLTSGTKTVSLTTTGQGWNCVGNPYTSAISMNTTADATATNNFITVNSSNLDPSYACVYVWDEDATYTGQSCYKVISNSGYSTSKTILAQNYVAPGQGFFVKANSSATNISFTSAMQAQQPGTVFKVPASNTSWPGITLTASNASTSSSAVIAFHADMTNGLDPTYDAGLLRGTNGLSLYTRLLDDNGVDFAIQCLPEEYDHLVIPVGIDYNAGGEITFTAETTGLPENCQLLLEDRTTQTYTSLLDGASYSMTVPASTSGIGRFYVHAGTGVTTGTTDLASGTLKVYMDNGTIIISGEINDRAIATLYDMQGQKLLIDQLQKGSINSILGPKQSGVYLLTIQQDGTTVTRKIINQ
jgi:hypothetical protein